MAEAMSEGSSRRSRATAAASNGSLHTGSSGTRHSSRTRTPSGFVSYQIPHKHHHNSSSNSRQVSGGGGSGAAKQVDNINLTDTRRRFYSATNLGRSSHNNHHHHTTNNNTNTNNSHSRLVRPQETGGGGKQQHKVQHSRDGGGDGRSGTAGIRPANLHNGGRPFSVQLDSCERPSTVQGAVHSDNSAVHSGGRLAGVQDRGICSLDPDYEPPPWAGGPRHTKRYPRSPLPCQGRRVGPDELEEERYVAGLAGAPRDQPRPPPRSRPRSWTSSLFTSSFINMLRGGSGGSKASRASSTLPHSVSAPFTQQPPSGGGRRPSSSLPQSNTCPVLVDLAPPVPGTASTASTLDRRQAGPKQVRFLANPAKNIEPNPKFYSLPRFIQQPIYERAEREAPHQQHPPPPGPRKGLADPASSGRKSAPSRTPSPFGRFVKSLVRGKDGNGDFECI